MPPPRKAGGEIPGRERSALTKAKRRGDAIDFKEEDFAKWVTGAHKRKLERQRIGHKEAELKVRMAKNAEKREQKEQMRQLVKQHFGDIEIDREGRVLISKHSNQDDMFGDGFSSEEEYFQRKQREQEVLERKQRLKEIEERQKNLPKWAKGKEEFLKDDSIIKEQNESFLRAQYSFNNDEDVDEIASKANRNKLLKNLEEERELERENMLKDGQKSNIMNFENDDSLVTVETSAMNIDSSSIVSRRAQRDLTLMAREAANNGMQGLVGKRQAAARLQSRQFHTVVSTSSTTSDDDDDDDDDDDGDDVEYGKKQPKNNAKKAQPQERQPPRSLIARIRAQKLPMGEESDASTSEPEEEQVVQVISKQPKDKQTQQPAAAAKVKAGTSKPTTQQPIKAKQPSTKMSDSETQDEEKEEWRVVEEHVFQDESSEDEDTTFKRQELARIAAERRAAKKTLAQAERLEKDRAKERAAAQEIQPRTKKQKTQSIVDSEFTANVQLAQQMSEQIVNLDIDVTKYAKPTAMTDASAWFMLPKPQAWEEEDLRKKRLLESRKKVEEKQKVLNIQLDRQPGSKLTNLEVMELDPTYGWDEGDFSNNKDLGAIFGIPAASMGGRHRKKPLSEKNKYRSSDARKAKKQEKIRFKEKQAAMAFEAGFADMNTKGRGEKIKWGSDDEDRFGSSGRASGGYGRDKAAEGVFDDFGKASYYVDKNGNKKQRQAGDRLPESGMNRKERKQKEVRETRRLEGAHKRGKMIQGKYFFGQKSGAVTL